MAVNMWWFCLLLASLVEVGHMNDEAVRTRRTIFRKGRHYPSACFKCKEVTKRRQFSSIFRVFNIAKGLNAKSAPPTEQPPLASDHIENSQFSLQLNHLEAMPLYNNNNNNKPVRCVRKKCRRCLSVGSIISHVPKRRPDSKVSPKSASLD